LSLTTRERAGVYEPAVASNHHGHGMKQSGVVEMLPESVLLVLTLAGTTVRTCTDANRANGAIPGDGIGISPIFVCCLMDSLGNKQL
jgi:hypothetical protein